MPAASVVLVRVAFGYLCAGAALGALMLAGKAVPGLAWSLALRPAHQDLLVAGWMLQLVFGVAFWILPRLPERARSEGTPRLVVAALLLNAGALLGAWGGVTAAAPVAAGGRAAQLLAALLFATLAWRRIRRYGIVAGDAGDRRPTGPAG
jgi:hypothetical protein